MNRADRKTIEWLQSFIHAQYGEPITRNGRQRGTSSVAREVVSAFIDQETDFKKRYGNPSIAKVLGCSHSGHYGRIRRFKDRCEDINFSTNANRIMELCTNEIERKRKQDNDRRAASQPSTGLAETSAGEVGASDYTDFMRTLGEL